MRSCLAFMLSAVCLVPSLACTSVAAEFAWQEPNVRILAAGDLEWTPQPFVFVQGHSVRYVDFAGGDDRNDGLTKQTPWKHHPWDPSATADAAACHGIHTYVFKRGVVYQCLLLSRFANRSFQQIADAQFFSHAHQIVSVKMACLNPQHAKYVAPLAFGDFVA